MVGGTGVVVGDGEGVGEGLGEGLGDGEGLGEGLGDGDGDGVGVDLDGRRATIHAPIARVRGIDHVFWPEAPAVDCVAVARAETWPPMLVQVAVKPAGCVGAGSRESDPYPETKSAPAVTVVNPASRSDFAE